MKHLLIVFLCLSVHLSIAQTLQPFTLSVISGQVNDVELLHDGNVQTGWFPGWNAGDYPVKILIELQKEVYLSDIKFYDNVGSPSITFFHVSGTDKTKLVSRELNLYQNWQSVEIRYNKKVKYLQVEISDIQGDRPITEIEIYGTDNNVNPAQPVISKYAGDALKLGANGFSWIPIDLNPTPNLRMYQMYQWTWTKTGLAVEPTFESNSNYDSYLQQASQAGKNIIFCINKIPNWYANTSSDEWFDQRIQIFGRSSTDPASYIDVAEYAWQLVARYGSVTYQSDLLKVNQTARWNGDPINQPKSGMNLIKYIELENEPDRPWKSVNYKYTPQELAAFCSAVWDGHEGKLGKHVGVKNVDKQIKVVLPGLAWLNTWYISEMKKWFEQNRSDKKFCADVLNFHHYSNEKNPFPGMEVNLWEGAGCSPETDKLDYRLKETKMWCQQNLPTCEVWYSEFGYDTNPPSTVLSQYPKLYGNKTAEQLQAQWLLRTYLYGLSAGFDKLMMFNLCDEDSADKGYLFGSSGLLTSQATGFKRKLSWGKVDWLVRELNNYKFSRDKSTPTVQVFEFKSKTVKSKFFYFSPTANGTTVKFKIGNKELTATEDVQMFSTVSFFRDTDVKVVNENNNK